MNFSINPLNKDFRLVGETLFFRGEAIATFPETVRPILREEALERLLNHPAPDDEG